MKINNHFTTLSCILTLQLLCPTTSSYAMEAGEEKTEELKKTVTPKEVARLNELEDARSVLASVAAYNFSAIFFQILEHLPKNQLLHALLLEAHMDATFGERTTDMFKEGAENVRKKMKERLEKLTLGNKLFGAIAKNDPDAVTQLIKAGAEPNIRKRNGLTPFMYAITRKSMTARSLLSAPTLELDAQNNDGKTALIHLLETGRWSPTKAILLITLLEKGTNVNIPDIQGNTPLMVIASKESATYVQYLERVLKAGARLEPKNSKGQTAQDIALSNYGSRPECYNLLEILDIIETTIQSVQTGAMDQWQAVQAIENRVASYNRDCPYNPVELLIAYGRWESAKTLIAWNMEVAHHPGGSSNRLTPLAEAIRSQKIDLVKLLLEHEALVDIKEGQKSALSTAISIGNPELVRLLVGHKASVSSTEMQEALHSNSPEIIDVLRL